MIENNLSCHNLKRIFVATLLKAQADVPPSPPISPYCVELPEDVVAKIAELDLELSEGDITQKGYEKKKGKLLAPFLRENQPGKSNGDGDKNGSGAGPSQTNGAAPSSTSSSANAAQPSSSLSSGASSVVASTPSAPPAESSLTTSGTSGLSDSSGKTKLYEKSFLIEHLHPVGKDCNAFFLSPCS